MPTWTLSNLMSEATSLLGNRTDISLSRASFYANEAQRHVWDSTYHEGAEAIAVSSTTVGENKIALPSDFQEIISVSNFSSNPPDVLTQVNVDTVDSLSTATGTPLRYARFSDWLELHPSPSSAFSLQLRYRTVLSDMTETTDRMSVATRYGLGVLYKTVELLGDSVKDHETAAFYNVKYISFMNSTPSDLALRQRAREGMHLTRATDSR